VSPAVSAYRQGAGHTRATEGGWGRKEDFSGALPRFFPDGADAGNALWVYSSAPASAPLSEQEGDGGRRIFTFYGRLPDGLPPTSVSADSLDASGVPMASVRYSYRVTLTYGQRTKSGSTRVRHVHVPFRVLSTHPDPHVDPSSDPSNKEAPRCHTGSALMMRAGEPCLVSATVRDRRTGIEVQSCHRGRGSGGAVQTYRAADRAGNAVADVSVFNSVRIPGERVDLHVSLEYARHLFAGDVAPYPSGAALAPVPRKCLQVCAALRATETASSADGLTRRAVRRHVLDAVRRPVAVPTETRSLSLSLSLPHGCPVSVRTPLVELAVDLVVEFALEGPPGKEAESLRLEVPLEVAHACAGEGDSTDWYGDDGTSVRESAASDSAADGGDAPERPVRRRPVPVSVRVDLEALALNLLPVDCGSIWPRERSGGLSFAVAATGGTPSNVSTPMPSPRMRRLDRSNTMDNNKVRTTPGSAPSLGRRTSPVQEENENLEESGVGHFPSTPLFETPRRTMTTPI